MRYNPPPAGTVAALVAASFDPDEGVRNNAVRALEPPDRLLQTFRSLP